MRKILLMAAAASMALAQGKPPASPARDGGVPPPARTSKTAADAGVPAAAAAAASAPTPGPGNVEAERLRKELNELKLRTTELERQLQARTENSEMEKMGKKLDDLNAKVQQLTDIAERQADMEEAAANKRTSTAAASASLNSVLTVLSTGNTSGIEPSLQYAESVFTGNALRDVQLARAALAQGDLASARQYLALALAEADAQR